VKLPWKTILMQGPTFVEVARRLLAMTRQTASQAELIEHDPDDADGLRLVVSALEQTQAEHARLVADLAHRVQELTTTVEMLHGRVRLALLAAIAAGGLAVVSLVVAWWR
jgi:hypothetical protein